MTVLQTLIDKKDNFEIIRDQIAAILAAECANQKALALLADPVQDPDDYDFTVYIERTNPWEQFFIESPDLTPVVNIWYDNSNFDGNASNISERQKTDAVFNIDCYAGGISSADGNGHQPGDEKAALEVQRALRLVRNILMAAPNTYLQLRGLVWKRWPQSINMFQPQNDTRPVCHVVAGRLALRVTFNEFSPQYVPETLEVVAVAMQFDTNDDGAVTINAEYDYT